MPSVCCFEVQQPMMTCVEETLGKRKKKPRETFEPKGKGWDFSAKTPAKIFQLRDITKFLSEVVVLAQFRGLSILAPTSPHNKFS